MRNSWMSFSEALEGYLEARDEARHFGEGCNRSKAVEEMRDCAEQMDYLTRAETRIRYVTIQNKVDWGDIGIYAYEHQVTKRDAKGVLEDAHRSMQYFDLASEDWVDVPHVTIFRDEGSKDET